MICFDTVLRGSAPKEEESMVQRCKTALCVLALMLALLAAWVQDVTWADQPTGGGYPPLTGTESFWSTGLIG